MADEQQNSQSYNSMQSGLGLIPPSFYHAKHPGEAAADIAQMAAVQMQQFNTQSQLQGQVSGRMFAPFTSMSPFAQIGGAPLMQMSPAVSNQLSGMGPSTGMFMQGSMGSQGASPYTPMPTQASAHYYGQMPPILPFPLQARLPTAQFETPYMAEYERGEAAHERSIASTTSMRGVGVRLGTDVIGAAIGGIGFGKWGAIAGAAATEFSGLGAGAQSLWMNTIGASQTAQAGRAAGIKEMSRSFVNSGDDLSESGQGFSREASEHIASRLTQLAGSQNFQKSTGGRFNTNDVFRIAQQSVESGLMTSAGTPEQMVTRVKDIAKNVRVFMELANEPDLRQAIQTMGSLRGMGLNISQTMDAVAQGRGFARAAGTTFQALASTGGAMGAQTYQSMGMTQGQGFRQGMYQLSNAMGSQNQGTLTPQMMALLGGPQGYAAMNTAFAGQFMQIPMLGAGMLNTMGGVNTGNVRNLMSGRTNVFDMASQAGSNLAGMANNMGPAGLGMAIGMQRFTQDSLSAMMSPEQQQLMRDRQIRGLAQTMGMRGSEGFMTAAQIMGMEGTQAMAHVREMGDPRYWERQRQQVSITASEGGREERRRMDDRTPGFWDNAAAEGFGGFRLLSDEIEIGWHRATRAGDSGHISTMRSRSENEAREFRDYERSGAWRTHQIANQGRETREAPISLSERMAIAQHQGLTDVTGVLHAGTMGMLNNMRVAGSSDREQRTELADIRQLGRSMNVIANAGGDEAARTYDQTANTLGGATTKTDKGAGRLMAGFSEDVARILNDAPGAMGSRTLTSLANGFTMGGTSILNPIGEGVSAGMGINTSDINTQIRESLVTRLRQANPTQSGAWIQAQATEKLPEMLEANASTIRLLSTPQAFAAMNIGRQSALSTESQRSDAVRNAAYDGGLAAMGINPVTEQEAFDAQDNSVSGRTLAEDTRTPEEKAQQLEALRTTRRRENIESLREFTGGVVAEAGSRIGDTDEQRTRARNITSAMAIARLAIVTPNVNADPDAKRNAEQRLRELTQTAQAEFTTPQWQEMQRLAEQHADELKDRESPELEDFARRAVRGTGAGMLQGVTQAGGTGQIDKDEKVAANITAGSALLSRTSRGIGRLIGSLNLATSEEDRQRFEAQTSHMSDQEIQRLTNSDRASERAFGEALLKGRDTGNYNDVYSNISEQGSARATREAEFEDRKKHESRMERFHRQTWREIFHLDEDTFGAKEARLSAPGGRAEASAADLTAILGEGQAEAEKEGIGGTNDRLRRAITSWETATTNFGLLVNEARDGRVFQRG
jgi:hypothetical protein